MASVHLPSQFAVPNSDSKLSSDCANVADGSMQMARDTLCRWGALDADDGEPSPSRKKRRTAAAPDDGDGFRTPAPSKTSAARLRVRNSTLVFQ